MLGPSAVQRLGPTPSSGRPSEVLARQDQERATKEIEEAWPSELTTEGDRRWQNYNIEDQLSKFTKAARGQGASKQLRADKEFPSQAQVKKLREAARKIIKDKREALSALAEIALNVLARSGVAIEV